MVRNLLLEAFRPRPGTVFVASTPLSHASGAFVVPTVLGGGALSAASQFDPEALLAVDSGALQTFVVPTMLSDLADAYRGERRPDAVIYGGAPCPSATLRRAVACFGDSLVQLYGQAEAPMTISILDGAMHFDLDRVAGSAGRPFAFVDVEIVDSQLDDVPQGEVGEVVVAAEHVMTGYWRDEEATAAKLLADGRLKTEDLGYLDDDGLLWLVDRAREIVITGGHNVFPGAVEGVLAGVAGVKEICVFGVPHPRWGEAVIAVVSYVPGTDKTVLENLLARQAEERLAYYQRPKLIVFDNNLPRTQLGKVSRRDLRNQYVDSFAG